MGEKEIGEVTYATIGSIVNIAHKFNTLGINKVIIDECDRFPREPGGMLRRFLTAAKITHVLGLTATPLKLQTNIDEYFRPFSKLVMLTSKSKKGNYFKEVIHVAQIKEMTELGFWSPLQYESYDFDTGALVYNSTNAEFTDDSIKRAYKQQDIGGKIIKRISELKDRKSILVAVPSIEEAKELSTRDKRLARVIDAHPLCTIGRNPKPVTHFEALVESVISQQLAVKAADTIYGRVKDLTKGRMVPGRIADISEADMRAAGVSGAKFKTIQGLADAALSKKIKINTLHEIDDDQLIFDQLTSLWGIGPWTVDMFMMFQLGRLDIWPTGDLGVRRGWEKIYALKDEIEPKALDKKGEKFRPYRSVVAWYCWRALT